jgi:hypothetical protein
MTFQGKEWLVTAQGELLSYSLYSLPASRGGSTATRPSASRGPQEENLLRADRVMDREQTFQATLLSLDCLCSPKSYPTTAHKAVDLEGFLESICIPHHHHGHSEVASILFRDLQSIRNLTLSTPTNF